ncbi:outer membrane protein assembly factor BamB family protein [Streptomyces montanisoli]|uniref:PQQ-binding-like beta-propeller repeat protein n=1 Tax=Streptomyces montanisoli TaxID=2798581 RepID=A0A940RVL6_9ACTN|nr:PQQ-binding-like beta-propeller repeat protein [Streptomyces montanisoli]MBP0459187.1 PQQ-binding-like beta-propeller repeat protein [Streptomyces montanisoli]
MTQPPQPPTPPNQPPAGGFGAPQTPGTPPNPQAPPQNPLYGYPQSAPGYGHPGGQPQAYGPPAGYGYPAPAGTYQQPQQPPAGGGGTGGGRGLTRTELRMIVAATVAVVLILAAGVWFSRSGGGSDDRGAGHPAKSPAGGSAHAAGGSAAAKEKAPADVHAKVAFKVAMPKATDLHSVYGSWLTDKVYAKSGLAGIVGYDPDSGTQQWSVPLPGDVCAASPHVSDDGKAAVVFDGAKRTKNSAPEACTRVGVVDLSAGRLLWSKTVKVPGGDTNIRFDGVTQTGNTVAAAGTSGGAGFDLATGEVRWKPKASTTDCHDAGYAGGALLVASRQCGFGDDAQITVENINPKTGATLSSYKMPPGVQDVHAVSTDPLVVAADVGDTGSGGISDFFSLDARTGKLKAKISASGDTYAARCEEAMENCTNVLAGNGKLYLPTAEHDAGDGKAMDRTNEIVSFDLATGKSTAQRADAGNGWTARLLRMDGPNLIAYKTGPYDKGGRIVSVDGSSFKQTTLLRNPSDRATIEDENSFASNGTEVRYADGRLFLSAVFVDKPLDAQDSGRPLVMAFSTR